MNSTTLIFGNDGSNIELGSQVTSDRVEIILAFEAGEREDDSVSLSLHDARSLRDKLNDLLRTIIEREHGTSGPVIKH